MEISESLPPSPPPQVEAPPPEAPEQAPSVGPAAGPQAPEAKPEAQPEKQTPADVTGRNRDEFDPNAAALTAARTALTGANDPNRRQQPGLGAPLDKILDTKAKANVRTDGNDLVLNGEVGAKTKDLKTRPGSRVGVDVGAGVQGKFEVRVPKDAANEAIRNGTIPNPADPNSWPTGTRVNGDLTVKANGDLNLRRPLGRAWARTSRTPTASR